MVLSQLRQLRSSSFLGTCTTPRTCTYLQRESFDLQISGSVPLFPVETGVLDLMRSVQLQIIVSLYYTVPDFHRLAQNQLCVHMI